ncbi:Ppx/GppA phosphatase family protein [Corynebacterium variabile]|uniref:Phosphatase n=2 Tax=Corynebacterium variabile TaxID=1727 RepID=A0A3B9QTU1_9CORY|nr:Ppx/GppA phosphatase family protein [Corynebacterium variabile]MDN6241242.1 Ppx/GppA family phosphatase [Corynebacterium variabile]MDN6478120.1 Ppx/GppA family phosphatase [Corynebacterium variabile]MDN6536942.1 Ppx/GppA family phosphatase [Corynebacterium variabile]MDN6619920.1 Ppx/GppA family phosphatase [Corynebacterium variabile]MDN6661932.1 Ppx/GppA family phosphatase [Corynebacterium variabile]
MRLGVLDVGSNTVHLVVVDMAPGGPPTPMSNWKTPMRLVEYLDKDGAITGKGAKKLIKGVGLAREMAEQFHCDELLPFATSAVRSATNGEKVLDAVEKETGVRLNILSGADEAKLTFLAVRRWYGWSAGRICDLDIGGGSLEMSVGVNEMPDVAESVNLGAGRLTHDWFETDPPKKKEIKALAEYIDDTLAEPVKLLRDAGPVDLAVGTSKTFRMLARLTGAAPSSAGPRVRRVLTQAGLRQLTSFISRMTAADRAELEGVSADRSHQIVAGALVAEAAMRHLGIEQLQMCPWALREGVILRRADAGEGVSGSFRIDD